MRRKRRRLTKQQSRRNFRRGQRLDRRNLRTKMSRGGFRL